MGRNPLDHSIPFELNLAIPIGIAEQIYGAIEIGGYKKSRLPQLQVLLANLLAHHKTDPTLYTSVSLANSYYKPKSRYNSLNIGKGLIRLIQNMADDGWLELHRGFRDAETGGCRDRGIPEKQDQTNEQTAEVSKGPKGSLDTGCPCAQYRGHHSKG